MTDYVTVSNSTGQCGQVFRGLDTAPVASQLMGDVRCIEVPSSFLASQYYFVGDDPVPFPPKPSPHHTFDYAIKDWIDPRTAQTEWQVVRLKRDALLRGCDFTQLADSPKNKQAWAAYRKELRDITLQADPFNVVWPVEPSS